MAARKQHDNAITDLTNQLSEYFDPFLDGPARHFKSGMEIDKDVINGLLSLEEIGEMFFKLFIEERIKVTEETKVSIFDPIKRQKIPTELDKEKKQTIKAGRYPQRGPASIWSTCWRSEAKTPKEALEYMLASVPLALANQNIDLREGSKATLCKLLIEDSNAFCDIPMEITDWFIDGMAAVIAVDTRKNMRMLY